MTPERIVYMDHSATTATDPAVVDAMIPWMTARYGNPSSVYRLAGESRKAVEEARASVATVLGADPGEIFFTSGGTEADNWAIKGVAFAHQKKGTHIITSAIEHHAVLHTCRYLEQHGFSVTILPVDETGKVRMEDLKAAITDQTILVSIMTANNEIGTIQPVTAIGALCREMGILFHTDAVQAIGTIPMDVRSMNIDLLSLSGHKFYGPKGAGALYIRKGVRVENLLHGGGQEKRKRAGTENVPGIIGLGAAIGLAAERMEEQALRVSTLRDRLLAGILERIPHTRLNGHPSDRLPGNINVSFEFIEGESILLLLDRVGICASTGSACTSGSLEPSHVLRAIGIPAERAHGSLRLTLGAENTGEDVGYVLEHLPGIISRLREMSPLYADFNKRSMDV